MKGGNTNLMNEAKVKKVMAKMRHIMHEGLGPTPEDVGEWYDLLIQACNEPDIRAVPKTYR